MRTARNLLIGLLALIVLLIGGAWVLPPLLDWNRFRDDVARLASLTLDQTVRIDGPLTLTLLPQPMLMASHVSVEATPGRPAISAGELRLRVALGALLSGRVDARELVLRDADIRLPWPFEPSALIVRAPSWLAAVSARIENGRLTVGDLTVTDIRATLATDDATGSVLTAGNARVAGREWRFTLRVTRPGGDGTAAFDLALDGLGKLAGTGASLTAQIQPDGSLLGRIAGRGQDLSLLIAAPPVPFSAEGRVSAAAGLVAADQLVGEIAGSPAQGAVALRISPAARLDVAVTASRLDLDAWGPALLQAVRAGSMPALPTGIDLSAEAARLGGATLRGLRAGFDFDHGFVDLREVRAVLPGDAALRVTGRVVSAAGGPQFDGQASLAAPDLRTTLAWAQAAGALPRATLPSGVLRTGDLAAHVAATANGVAFTALTGHLDGTAVEGSLAFGGAAPAALQASLAVDRLDLDAWLPGAPSDLPATFSALAAAAGTAGFDLRLSAKQALWHGITVQPLALEAAGDGGKFVLRRLDLQALGAQIGGSATLVDGGRIADAKFDLQAPHAAALMPLLPVAAAAWADRLPQLFASPLAAQVQLASSGETLTGQVTATLGDLRLEAQPSLDPRTGSWHGAVTLRHPGAPRLAELLGLGAARPWLGDGSLGLIAQVTADGEHVSADNFDLSAGLLHAGGALALDFGPVPSLTGHIDADTLTLPDPLPVSTDPLPVQALAGWKAAVRLEAARVLVDQVPLLTKATAMLTLADGVLRLDGLSAGLGGGTLKAGLRLDAAATPPTLGVDAALADCTLDGGLFGTPVDLDGGAIDATAGLTAAGYAPAALLASLAGAARLHAHGGTFAGVALDRASDHLAAGDVAAALAGGSTPFTDLDAELRIDRGVGEVAHATMAAPAGTMTLDGSIDLAHAALDLRLGLHPAVPDAPEIGLRLTGPAADPQRLPQLGDVIRWRAAHPG